MQTYAEIKIFSEAELKLWRAASEIVAWLPGEIDGTPVRCHELARFVGGLLGLEVQDGHFGFVEHSWLWTAPRNGNTLIWQLPKILDVYVPGQLPPVQLIHIDTGLPMGYHFGEPREDIRSDVLAAMREYLQKHAPVYLTDIWGLVQR